MLANKAFLNQAKSSYSKAQTLRALFTNNYSASRRLQQSASNYIVRNGKEFECS